MLPFIEFWMKGRKQNVTLWLRRSSLSGSSHCLLYNSYVVNSEIFFAGSTNNPLLIFSFILITYLLIWYWYSKKKFCLGHSLELKGQVYARTDKAVNRSYL